MSPPDNAWLDAPDGANADAEADAIDRAAGIPEPGQTSRSVIVSLVIPVIVAGVVFIAGMWFVIGYFHLLG